MALPGAPRCSLVVGSVHCPIFVRFVMVRFKGSGVQRFRFDPATLETPSALLVQGQSQELRPRQCWRVYAVIQRAMGCSAQRLRRILRSAMILQWFASTVVGAHTLACSRAPRLRINGIMQLFGAKCKRFCQKIFSCNFSMLRKVGKFYEYFL